MRLVIEFSSIFLSASLAITSDKLTALIADRINFSATIFAPVSELITAIRAEESSTTSLS